MKLHRATKELLSVHVALMKMHIAVSIKELLQVLLLARGALKQLSEGSLALQVAQTKERWQQTMIFFPSPYPYPKSCNMEKHSLLTYL